MAPLRHRLPRGLRPPSTPWSTWATGPPDRESSWCKGRPARSARLAFVAPRETRCGGPAHRHPSPNRAGRAHSTGQASPGTARAACDTAPPAGHGMPHAVARPVPSPGAKTSESRARHDRGGTDISHIDPDLAVVDLPPVPAPLALDPDRVRAALREAAGIKGDDAIGFAQLLDHLPDQHSDQWPMIPGSGANEVLDDLSLDIDEGGDFLGILAVHVGQQPLEVEMDMGCPPARPPARVGMARQTRPGAPPSG